jgi:protein-disulfide isomerase/uncharacterized membrane protein
MGRQTGGGRPPGGSRPGGGRGLTGGGGPAGGGKPGAPAAGRLRETRISNTVFWQLALLLSVAVVLSAFLISKHFGSGLPGCGPRSGCEALESTSWGTVPGIRWPVSFLGFTYFFALLVGWMAADRRVPIAARWLLRVGGAASLVFIGVMVALGKFCPYCLGIHAANIGVLVLLELELRRSASRARAGGSFMPWSTAGRMAGVAGGAFVVASLALGIANARFQGQLGASAEQERRASTDQILAQTKVPDASRPADQGRPADTSRPADTGRPADTARPPDASHPAEANGSAGFTGRYRLGPAASPIRVVMLTDYQCPDCKRIEGEIDAILASRQDVSLSVKNYPFCQEAAPGVPCNPYVKQTLHANACWAARAAEAAGMLKGDEGFWMMHRWLFAHGGVFTEDELKNAVAQQGYDVPAFLTAMQGPETLRRVQADCAEGQSLGLYFTPMIFVNGVEFKGWQTPGALQRTIEEVAAAHPPALTAAADRPPKAGQKDIDDWMAQPVHAMPPDSRAWSMGALPGTPVPAGTRFVDVVIWGDYQEPYTAAMDRAIRDFMKGRPNIRYTFRHYPIDPGSNPAVPPNVRPEAIHPLAGRAAKAAEAAGTLAGSAGYWKMHAWLMEHVPSFNDGTLRAAAVKMGLDPDRLLAEMGKPAAAAAISEDAFAGKQLGLAGVPFVFVNGKWVQRTLRDGNNVVLGILEAAGRP